MHEKIWLKDNDVVKDEYLFIPLSEKIGEN